jgi:hypothetical protein
MYTHLSIIGEGTAQHGYTYPAGKAKNQERKELMLSVMKACLTALRAWETKIHVVYLCYSETNPNCRNS